VAQEQVVQVLGVRPVGQPGAVGVPGHQVVGELPLTGQVFAHRPRPDQLAGPQHLERPGHLAGVQVALVPHEIAQVGELAVVDEQAALAGPVKSVSVVNRVRLASRSSWSRAMPAAAMANMVLPRQ
jgi:hypothetical protein